MRFDLKGRVANFDLPVSKALHPLFEAVVNSIHAIDEKYPDHPEMGKIIIDVLRYADQVMIESVKDGIIQPVVGFVIQDNGIGFNEENYTSFDTSDSTYKLQLGGKGVGRFCWLKAFDNIVVESVYGEGNKKKCKFDFTIDSGITNPIFSMVEATIDTYSKVVLEGFKGKYQKACPKRLDVIASKIIEHCLSFFCFRCMSQHCYQRQRSFHSLTGYV